MIDPVVTAFSASCSAKATAAPRPATRDGSRAARVTAGDGPAAYAAPAEPVTRLRPAAQAVAAAAQRGGTPARLGSTNIDRLFLIGRTFWSRGEVTIEFL